MILTVILVFLFIYVFLIFVSLTHSCAGYSIKECGICWVGIIQLPLVLLDSLFCMTVNKINRGKK